uniref:Thioesterase domain-containing protein n=1 Tax=Chrysotila carterae TaxID=13221 RepID=A0A7S4B4F7_CHRCT
MAAGARLRALLDMMAGAEQARFLRRRSFADQLLLKRAQQAGRYTSFADNVLRFEYKVSEAVCTGAGDTFPLTSLIAIMDETTTWASIGLDPNRRPGVSISMDAHLIRPQPVRAGEVLIFCSSLVKHGRTLGFLECSVEDESGARMAWGKHVKFLESEFADLDRDCFCSCTHALCSSEALLTSSCRLACAVGRTWNLLFSDQMFPLTSAMVRFTSGPSRPQPPLHPRLGDVLRLEAQSVAADGTTTFNFDCGEDHLNELGVMHGACQAVLHGSATEAVVIDAPAAGRDHVTLDAPREARVLKDASVTYLSAGRKGPLILRVTPLRRDGAGESYVSKLMTKHGLRVLSEATLLYGPQYIPAR